MVRAALTFASRERRLIMTHCKLSVLPASVLCAPLAAQCESADPCAALAGLKIDGVEITKAALVPAGTTVPPPYPGATGIGPLPAHCGVDGVINRRRGADGQELGIGFALALPETASWNGDFMMQGGGGGLLPVRRYLEGASFREVPSIFCWRYSDRLLDVVAWTGLGTGGRS